MDLKKIKIRIGICFKSKLISLTTIITTVVSGMSLAISFLSSKEPSLLPSWLFWLSVLLLVLLFIFTISPFFTAKVYDKKTDINEINEYMENLYSNATGKIIISTTGGMSWATEKIMNELEKKAKSSGVVIFIPRENEKTDRLQKAGVKIITDHAPNINFSIINPEADDARIAIGRSKINGIHCITEHESRSDVMVVARELVSLLENLK